MFSFGDAERLSFLRKMTAKRKDRLPAPTTDSRLLGSKNRATQEGMKHAYLGWIDCEGLKGFQPETESVDRFLIRLRQQLDRNTVGIWSVLDTEVLDSVQSLLDAAEYQAALHCLLCHATFVGQHR